LTQIRRILSELWGLYRGLSFPLQLLLVVPFVIGAIFSFFWIGIGVATAGMGFAISAFLQGVIVSAVGILAWFFPWRRK